ncbi:MAG: NupC/NupG family nucleoside CNT transporter [Opitutales bacterium]|nr:NupC/NupG family nucleoside CNT transporter [Opitutales bacterium]
MSYLMSLVGMGVLLAVAFALSNNRKAINYRTVGGAFAIQFSFGAFVLYVPWGKDLLKGASDGVTAVINYGMDGSQFLFGTLASDKSFGAMLAFVILPTLIFFSSLISVLYHWGIMQWVIRILGGALSKALGTSRAESMSAAANIFVGLTEAPLVVKPFLSKMTESELFAVMCGGLASIAGGVLAGYASMGVPVNYLVAASFMAAPGGMLFAKILRPETATPDNSIPQIEEIHGELPENLIDAAATGAGFGLKLALNVAAMLIAFISLIALLNGLLGEAGALCGHDNLTLQQLLGWVISPVAFLLGVPWSEAHIAGALIGEKIIATEFVAYAHFVEYMGDSSSIVLSEKTKGIITFALCGFANIASIAILVGGLGGLAPSRRKDIARLGVLAMIAGTLSNLMSATIAGFFLSF